MIRNRARNLVLALSLFAAVGSILPGSHVAAAAPIPAADSVTDGRWEEEQAQPSPVLAFAIRKPNVGISFVQQFVLAPHMVQYVFKVQNYGNRQTGRIDVRKAFSYLGCSGWCYHNHAGEYVAPLDPGASKMVVVFCNTLESQICLGAGARVEDERPDPDEANNFANTGVGISIVP